MKSQLKLTSWNAEWVDKLFDNPTDKKLKRINAIAEEIIAMNPDILCLIEGPKGNGRIDEFCTKHLNGAYIPVKEGTGNYKTQGRQWIWFLVKPELAVDSSILSPTIWDDFAGPNWKVNYWGNFETENHKHYRHPQVLIFSWKTPRGEVRVEFIGLHTKSKFVNEGQSMWKEGGERKQEFIQGALKARVKLTTEISNVRKYIDKKFEQLHNPAIFVCGDLNDGPGKETFENQYLFFDLLSNLQGSVFEAYKFLNHGLFDYKEELRWTCIFDDFVENIKGNKILIDHILFTQATVDSSLPIIVEEKSGYVEHEIHDLINATLPGYAKTSDHKPVSLLIKENEKFKVN
jgi:hypothetical protein